MRAKKRITTGIKGLNANNENEIANRNDSSKKELLFVNIIFNSILHRNYFEYIH